MTKQINEYSECTIIQSLKSSEINDTPPSLYQTHLHFTIQLQSKTNNAHSSTTSLLPTTSSSLSSNPPIWRTLPVRTWTRPILITSAKKWWLRAAPTELWTGRMWGARRRYCSHSLYEQLLSAHVAYLRVDTSVDQLPRIDAQLA